MKDRSFDLIVIGGGHAGCEAALAAARMGCKVLMLAMNLDSIALMPCNPAIGGPAKAHLVCEIDALGGEMGKNINATMIQIRMLNTNKGAAVRSLRAQADKIAYQRRMKYVLEREPNLQLKQSVAEQVLTDDAGVSGIVTNLGTCYNAKNIIITTGTYLAARIIIGETNWPGGPNAMAGPTRLSESLRQMGLALTRFKTDTPPRVDGNTLDFTKMELQPGEEAGLSFSFYSQPKKGKQVNCWLTHTTAETHALIRDNLHRAPLFTGKIQGVGPRYCPSIEDKVVRFADKNRHQLFLEPEGLDTSEYYVQGMSTSLPEDVQTAFLRTIPGLEQVEIIRPGYAIEYDVLIPTQLQLSLESKTVPGLFFAGQVNGTSGYEEAAAQGLMAGINAARRVQGLGQVILQRSQAYIGVLIDDLVVKGTDEPYRMLTSRAEFRLLLRHDNADSRLSPLGHQLGLLSDADHRKFLNKWKRVHALIEDIDSVRIKPEQANEILADCGSRPIEQSVLLADLVRRPEVSLAPFIHLLSGEYTCQQIQTAETEIKYRGYVARQQKQVEQMERLEAVKIPHELNYAKVPSLSSEGREKLSRQQPQTLGQASRISGVSPADISLLSIYLKAGKK